MLFSIIPSLPDLLCMSLLARALVDLYVLLSFSIRRSRILMFNLAGVSFEESEVENTKLNKYEDPGKLQYLYTFIKALESFIFPIATNTSGKISNNIILELYSLQW